MNEWIQKFAEQAKIRFESHLQHQGVGTAVIIPTDLEKFSELIVQECIKIALKEGQWYFDREEWGSSSAIEHAARRIKEHFKDK